MSDGPYYILARLRIRYGQIEKFAEIMKETMERVGEVGWTLVGSYQAVIGDFNEVVDIWQVPSLEAAYAAVDPTNHTPERQAHLDRLGSVIESESIQIVTKTSFAR